MCIFNRNFLKSVCETCVFIPVMTMCVTFYYLYQKKTNV